MLCSIYYHWYLCYQRLHGGARSFASVPHSRQSSLTHGRRSALKAPIIFKETSSLDGTQQAKCTWTQNRRLRQCRWYHIEVHIIALIQSWLSLKTQLDNQVSIPEKYQMAKRDLRHIKCLNLLFWVCLNCFIVQIANLAG
jgi:hypothetical protein